MAAIVALGSSAILASVLVYQRPPPIAAHLAWPASFL
jgi:hypothetical protein